MSAVDRFRAAEGDDLCYLERAATAIKGAADDLRTDNEQAVRKELRERLQILEGWKAGALPGSVEAVFIDDLMWLYRDALGVST